MNPNRKGDVIIALDFPTAREVTDFLALFPALLPEALAGGQKVQVERTAQAAVGGEQDQGHPGDLGGNGQQGIALEVHPG